LLIVISTFGQNLASENSKFSQSNEILIKFIGNCGLHLTDGELNIYIDFPYKSGAHGYMKFDKLEIDSIKESSIFIFTHRHSDHYSKKLLKKLNGKKYENRNVSELEKLNNSLPDFNIKAFKTKHKVFGISFKHYSYFITWHSKKIYISGDTGDFNDVSRIKDIDWAFMNPWSYIYAENAGVIIDAKKIGIYHLTPERTKIGNIPDNLLILIKQGEIIKIPY